MVRVHRSIMVGLLGLVLWGASAWGFDGDRKGLALGLGAGVSPLARLRGTDDGKTLQENARGFGASISIGFGISGADILRYEANVAGFSSSLYGDSSRQTFTGFSWYHYFGPPGRAFFGALGFGRYEYDWEGSRIYICWGDDCNPPPALPHGQQRGLLVGGGYEFAERLQLGAFLAKSISQYDGDFSFLHLNILFQYTWY